MRTATTPQPRPHRSTQRLRLALLLPLALCLSSCSHLDLVRVHDVYRAEFQDQLEARGEAGPTPTPARTTFPETLEAIQAFRENNPAKANALKHLAVLEAMVYLQSGHYGMARAAAARAESLPGSLTQNKHNLIRDAVFLEALTLDPGLIEAFQMIHGDLPKDEAALQQCGHGLSELARKHRGLEGDHGAIHIAAVAADCHLFAMQQATLGAVGTPEERALRIREAQLKHGTAAMEALAPHLTDLEKGATPGELESLANWSSRYKYVRFYHIAKSMRDGNQPNR